MANLLLLQDKLGEDFNKKKTRRASKAALAGKINQESPNKELAQMPPKYQMKEDDDKQVILILNHYDSYHTNHIPVCCR